MNKRLIIGILLATWMFPAFAAAQDVEVKGRVRHFETNEPLPGVTVLVKGLSGLGTVTAFDGSFQLRIPLPSTLLFSFVGFTSEEIRVSENQFLDITLKENIQEIEELVIVGTAFKKSDLTGSVSRVVSEVLKEVPTSSVTQALQGKVPGIYIQSNPAPGAKSSIKIRGNNSIQYGTNPIFVVDGLVIDGGFEMLNPDDIATVDVLKDASATAIYGSRGANGVLVITTKKGSKGNQKITYDTWMGFQEFSNEMPLMTGPQVFDLRVDAYANAYMDKYPNANRENYIAKSLTVTNPVKNLIFSKEELESYARDTTYNWLDEVTRRGYRQNHSVSMSGGNENGNYYLSFNYNKQIGQLQKSGYKRYTGKINLDQVVKSWLKVGTSNSFIYTNEQPVGNGNMFITALRACPLLPLSKEYWYMREGKIDNQSASNPLRDLYIDADIFSNRLMSTNYVTITPLKGLNIRSTFSIDLLQSENYSYFPTTSTQSYKSVYDGQSVQVKSKNANWQWDNSLSYERTFADRHRLSLILGTNRSFYDYNYNQQNANGYNNDLFSYKYSQGASDKENFYLASNFISYSLSSYLSRINYSYDSRYYLTLSGRYDGSSKFGTNNKWGFFPSVAGSWNITGEDFMDNQHVFSNLRLRLGYGIAGNQNIPNYGYMTIFAPSISLGSNILTNGGRYGNPDLRWEKQKQLNAGIDAAILKDRISLSFDIFHINNEDLLMERSTAPSSGYLTMIDNVGALENKGVEFALNVDAVKSKKINWTVSFNIAADKNKITRLYEDVKEIYRLGGYSNNEIQRVGNLFVGQPLNNIYVYKFDRIIQESDMPYVNSLQLGSRVVKPGDILPLDRDSNKIINDLDRFVVGKNDPDFYGGFSSFFSYRGIALNMNITYSVGADRVSYLYETLMGSIGNSAAHTDLLKRWTPENTNTGIPRAYSDGGRFGLGEVDWAVQDASFVRLSELSLSYTFPKKWMNAVRIDNLRIYCTGNNLLTITPYKGYDPDSGDWYPSSRSWFLGLNIGF